MQSLKTRFYALGTLLRRQRLLIGICLCLLLFSGALQSYLTAQFVRGFLSWAEQAWNVHLAENFADRIAPYVRGPKVDYGTLRAATYELKERAPNAEFYIVDRVGFVKLHFHDQTLIRRTIINPDPIRRFIQRAGASEISVETILGDDPLSLTGQKPFSAAEISYAGERAYLYVLLGSTHANTALSKFEQRYILRASAVAFAITVLATGLVATIVMLVLGRRHQSVRQGIADLTHDLKGPLASVQGYLETILMRDKTMSSEQRHEFLSVALRNAKSMKDMAGALLDLSTLDDMEGKIAKEPLSIADLLSDIVMKFNPAAAERGVKIDVLPESAEPPLLNGDVRLLDRALSNLVDNAIRHTNPEGIVALKLTYDAPWVKIQVIDSGEGVAPENLAHVFDRHYSGSAERGGSRGLGLAIAKKIIELHGGTITVQSEVDTGTCFEIKLRG